MKSFAVVLLIAQAVMIQYTYAQVIRAPCGCGPSYYSPTVVASPPIIATPTNSVANSLADTLSLLTVSSLLADTLPYGYDVIGVPTGYGCGYGCGGCGCGGCGCGGCGCGGYGYRYIY